MAALHAAVREVEADAGHPLAIVADLQGPKLRIGAFAGGEAQLKAGAGFRLDADGESGDGTRVSLPHREVFAALEPGMDLLLDDGRVRLRVVEAGPRSADTKVVVGGVLSDRKGVNVPGAELPLRALTVKDRRDLAFAVGLGVDWLALSFVQRADDIAEARRLAGPGVALMAKIEKPAAVERFDEILELADGIMVARGDLGVEIPPEQVPSIQKRIVRAAREAGKPVVVATQMLDSMIRAPEPTRAEASDVATAVYDGGDAVMLSAETAAGAWPVEAVDMMRRIVERVEGGPASCADARSRPHGARADRGGRFERRSAAGRSHHRRGGHRHLYPVGRDGVARLARAARYPDPVPHPGASDGAPPGARLGSALRPRRRRARLP